MRTLLTVLSLFAVTGCVPKAPAAFTAPDHVRAVRDQIDWDVAGAQASAQMADFLRIESVNPIASNPTGQRDAAQFLADILAEDGIRSDIVEYRPGHVNLIATLPGSGEQAPLCLLSHLDVVPGDAEHWDNPPYSGTVDDEGRIWGRGALDMKSLGLMEALTMSYLARLNVPLNRDIILLAVSDEEVDNTGARWVADNWDDFGCSHLINEGGIGVEDALFDGQAAYFISVGEKGTAWVDIVATGEPSHGSTPLPDQSPDRLISALSDLDRRKVRYRIPEPMYELLDAVGRHQRGLTGAVLTRPFWVRTLAKGKLMREPAVRATASNTCNVTGMLGAGSHNTVSGRSVAHYDCRLQPETKPEAFVEELRALIRTEGVHIEEVGLVQGSWSPIDDPLYEAIAKYTTEGQPDAVAGPVLSVGFTDSILLRPLGVHAYGIAPIRITQDEAFSMHGHNEYIREDDLRDGLYRLLSIVTDQATTTDPQVAH
jgi:acetylornithine deacetylase/succinyl-diaminopimelate desuccinylase-like protein